jgi:hypothetical protein
MAGETFRSQTLRRLTLYKRDVLKIHEDGIWLKNQRAYPHILPISERRLNILPAFRDEFWKWFADKEIRLHGDFHHLNSSQALCFNLFFPFLMQRDQGVAPILKALSLAGSPIAGASFEFVPDNIEGTNFDFMIPLDAGRRVYFEVKYTESRFGSAKEDDEHLRKFHSIYSSRTAARFEVPFCTPSGFLKNYQILRNLWHLDLTSGDTAVFLFPRANKSLGRAEGTVRSCLLERFRSRVIVAYIEDLVSALSSDPQVGESKDALSQFRQKYLLTPLPSVAH